MNEGLRHGLRGLVRLIYPVRAECMHHLKEVRPARVLTERI